MHTEEYIKERRRESLKDSFKKRRGKLEIIMDILSVAMKEAKKTEIVYKANLNFKRVGKYLPYLEEKGLIENIGSEYKTTEKGKQFLRDYQKMQEQLK
ncbi:MAG: winged helix-turn-helix domain-containing protein [Methanophagales archaeon]|nr:winged helix-turn-helix domain-containing protein [Methanophagales archaeon]